MSLVGPRRVPRGVVRQLEVGGAADVDVLEALVEVDEMYVALRVDICLRIPH